MDRAVFDRMASLDTNHWWFEARRRVIASLIRRRAGLGPGARVLEVGCGTGGNLAMLREFGQLDAVELDEGARAIAASRSGLTIRTGALPDGLPADYRDYDLIVLLDVLEHVEADDAALAELRTRLRPGGRLLITVPAYPWLWSPHDTAHHHHRRYTAATLRRRFTAAGFRVDTLTYFNSLLFPLIAAIRLGQRLCRVEAADDSMPAPWLNRVLTRVFASERHAVGRVALPFGVSLAAVAVAR